MTMWQLLCAAWLADDDLTVLGPKCHAADCMSVASTTVHWVTGPMRCCEWHTAKWQQVAGALGMALHVERHPDWTPPGLDDAERRFALLELD